MKESIICHLPAIGEMAHNRVEVSKTEAERAMREQNETIMLEGAYRYGQCYLASREKGKHPIDVFNELPDYIMVKDREFKKDLDHVYIRDFGDIKIPFAMYAAIDGNIKESPAFIWLKKSQIRPTRVLTMKY